MYPSEIRPPKRQSECALASSLSAQRFAAPLFPSLDARGLYTRELPAMRRLFTGPSMKILIARAMYHQMRWARCRLCFLSGSEFGSLTSSVSA